MTRDSGSRARVFFCAGESSGDTHGANLIRALRVMQPDIECFGLGGRAMESAGMALDYDLAGDAIMGFTEVVRSFPSIRRLFHTTLDELSAYPPNAAVFIDYPGFNLRLAQKVHALGVPVIYYISPQVWAWKKGRIKTIARCVDKMLVILPFEEAIYREAGVDCTYVGHPLLDHVDSGRDALIPNGGRVRGSRVNEALESESLIGLLPGSRAQEIGRIFPVMLEVAAGLRERYSQARFVVPCVNAERESQILALARGRVAIETRVGGMHELLRAARFCMVASGTATVETALFGVPMVVLYRVSPITYLLARLLVRVESIAMVNLLAERPFVPEFIQGNATPERILPKAVELIEETDARRAMLEGLARVRERLGSGGASANAAREVWAAIEGANQKAGHGR